jgi:DNA-binding GntR family transcriptional regulator
VAPPTAGARHCLSENALIAPSMEAQWTSTQRVMGEVLMRDEKPRDIWDQHEAMLAEVAGGYGAVVEELARQHVLQAAHFMVTRLRNQHDSSNGPFKPQHIFSFY